MVPPPRCEQDMTRCLNGDAEMASQLLRNYDAANGTVSSATVVTVVVEAGASQAPTGRGLSQDAMKASYSGSGSGSGTILQSSEAAALQCALARFRWQGPGMAQAAKDMCVGLLASHMSATPEDIRSWLPPQATSGSGRSEAHEEEVSHALLLPPGQGAAGPAPTWLITGGGINAHPSPGPDVAAAAPPPPRRSRS